MTAIVEQPELAGRSVEGLLAPRTNKYMRKTLLPKQALGLTLPDVKEVFYGGALGAAKTEWLLQGALQYVDIPRSAALIVRKTVPELWAQDGLIERALAQLAPFISTGEVKWNQQRLKFTFPRGASLQFGSLQNPGDRHKFQGAAVQFLGIDELCEWKDLETSLLFLMTRVRRTHGLDVPLRVRATSNPEGPGLEAVKARYIDPATRAPGVVFIPASMKDNPHLSVDDYAELLANLPVFMQKRLVLGLWDAAKPGDYFSRGWFRYGKVPDKYYASATGTFWDLASSKKKGADYTVGLTGTMILPDPDARPVLYVWGMHRGRWKPGEVEAIISQVADQLDGEVPGAWVFVEKQPATGAYIEEFFSHSLEDYSFELFDKGGADKEKAAYQVSAAASQGRVKLVKGSWTAGGNLKALLNECEAFPEGEHDDTVDALSGLYNALNEKLGHRVGIWWPGKEEKWASSRN